MNHHLDELNARVRLTLTAIAASPARRRAMHEELLAHLLASYEEELARAGGGHPSAAIDAATRRLGDPDTLRHQLQSTVPFIERLFFRSLPRKENPMSRWLWLLAVCAFLIGTSIVLPCLGRHKQQGIPWSTLAPSLAIGLAITLSGLGTILYGVVRRLRRRTAA